MQLKTQVFLNVILCLLLSSYGRFGGAYYLSFQILNTSLCRSQWSRGPRWSLACWDWGFESNRGLGCLSVVSVVCCQVDVCARSWSLVKRSPTECRSSLCVIYKPGPLGAVAPKTNSPLTPRERFTLKKSTDFWLWFCSLVLGFRQWFFMKCTDSGLCTRVWIGIRTCLKDGPDRQIDKQSNIPTNRIISLLQQRRFGPFFEPYQAIP
jgi:hypothetical protein